MREHELCKNVFKTTIYKCTYFRPTLNNTLLKHPFLRIAVKKNVVSLSLVCIHNNIHLHVLINHTMKFIKILLDSDLSSNILCQIVSSISTQHIPTIKTISTYIPKLFKPWLLHCSANS